MAPFKESPSAFARMLKGFLFQRILPRMDDLPTTDDMDALMRAAYAVAPNGEIFILEQLALREMSDVDRKDCAFRLERTLNYLARNTDADQIVKGTPYTITKIGRPFAKQLIRNKAKARKETIWKAAIWLWSTFVGIGGAAYVGHWLNQKIERIEKRQQQPTTQSSLNLPT